MALIALFLSVLGATCAGSAMGARPRPHPQPVLHRAPAAQARVSAETKKAHAPLRWLHGRLPPGGNVVGDAVIHTIREGESWQSIADAYLELTSIYDALDLAKAIVAENLPDSKRGPTPGLRVRIPSILQEAPKTGAAARLGLPEDGILKGIYVRGTTAGARTYPTLLDRLVAHGMNAIVLDVKDYDGPLTYPSKVPLAIESGAVDSPPMRSYARAVRFAHERGVRVIARVSCFNDALMAKAHPSMAIRGISGHVYRNGWLDPRNERAQNYILDLVRETIDMGVDEVQLDYVRFPVIGMKNIDFGLDTRTNPNAKIEVITRFVERVHALTRARGVPLSVDVFGVIAFGKRVDMQNLGQDPAELAKHAEFLSAMVYPSHFDPGFMGREEPADHPELVGLGVKHMLAQMDSRGVDLATSAKIRPWLQAMRHGASNYGAGYIQEEIRTSDRAGGQGWLLWNPGQVYDVVWAAIPRMRVASDDAGRPVRKRLKHVAR
jgi:hypothetical protein